MSQEASLRVLGVFSVLRGLDPVAGINPRVIVHNHFS